LRPSFQFRGFSPKALNTKLMFFDRETKQITIILANIDAKRRANHARGWEG